MESGDIGAVESLGADDQVLRQADRFLGRLLGSLGDAITEIFGDVVGQLGKDVIVRAGAEERDGAHGHTLAAATEHEHNVLRVVTVDDVAFDVDRTFRCERFGADRGDVPEFDVNVGHTLLAPDLKSLVP